MILSFQKTTDETNIEFMKRVSEQKEAEGCTWQDIADTINSECGLCFTESYYRKHFGRLKNENEYRQKVAERDDDNEKRAMIRREAREETIRQIAHDAIQQLGSFNVKFHNPASASSDNEGIVMLSDWHYGIQIDSYFNRFNCEIAQQRIADLTGHVIRYIRRYKMSKLHVVNLGDLICGRIHLQLRLQSQTDVISQTMEVAEILSEMLKFIVEQTGVDVEYYDTLDNHSRLEPLKENSLDLESLVRIITWFLKERFEGCEKVHFNNNVYADDIVSFNVLGHDVIAVHGHKDPPTKAIEQLSMLTQKHYDLVLTSHYHHFNADEQNETVRISNGSLMGTDNYAQDLRLNSKPSQTFIVATKENVCEAIHKINL